MFKPRKKTQ